MLQVCQPPDATARSFLLRARVGRRSHGSVHEIDRSASAAVQLGSDQATVLGEGLRLRHGPLLAAGRRMSSHADRTLHDRSPAALPASLASTDAIRTALDRTVRLAVGA